MSDYHTTRICKVCKHEKVTSLTKSEAAFFAVRFLALPCENCGSTEIGTGGWDIPDVDADLLTQWIEDEKLSFLDQDEELIVADAPFEALQAAYGKATSKTRKGQLAISIAIKVYDDNCASESEEEACIGWLRTNVDAWRNWFDYDYVSRSIAERLDLN